MKSSVEQPYTVYILKCSDGTLYTGIALNLEHRLETHREGKGAKYVKARLPFTCIYSEQLASKSLALKREIEIKSWSRAGKIRRLNLTL